MFTSEAVPPVDDRDHVRGATDYRVTIVEYGDYDCPHTRAAQAVIDRLLAENADVRLVFRPFPLRHLHPRAEVLARIAEATSLAKGPFWALHDYLMNPESPNDEASVLAEAARLGADVAKIKAEVNGRIIVARIEGRVEKARAAGVHSTPTFFFNGTLHDGHYDYDMLNERLSAGRIAGPMSKRG